MKTVFVLLVVFAIGCFAKVDTLWTGLWAFGPDYVSVDVGGVYHEQGIAIVHDVIDSDGNRYHITDRIELSQLTIKTNVNYDVPGLYWIAYYIPDDTGGIALDWLVMREIAVCAVDVSTVTRSPILIKSGVRQACHPVDLLGRSRNQGSTGISVSRGVKTIQIGGR